MHLSESKFFKIIFTTACFLFFISNASSTGSYATLVTTGAGTVINTISTTSYETAVTTGAGTIIDVLTVIDSNDEVIDADIEIDVQTLSDITSNTTNHNVDEELGSLEIFSDDSLPELTDSVENPSDVNNSGDYTLLDLGIDARHFGKNPNSPELSEYNTDIVVNNEIDDDDLLEISRRMMLNSNYEH